MRQGISGREDREMEGRWRHDSKDRRAQRGTSVGGGEVAAGERLDQRGLARTSLCRDALASRVSLSDADLTTA